MILWGIHGGKTGEADALFLRNSVIALGWSKVGDLTKLKAERDAFKAVVESAYPEQKPGALPVIGGVLFRFVHEMKVGDEVAYPSKRDRQVHLGRITTAYRYEVEKESAYPHRRSVKWYAVILRTNLSQGALYEIGSIVSLFQIKNYSDEFRAAAEGKPVPPLVSQDESVGAVADEIVESTRDFILKRLAQELKGHPMAEFVALLFNTMGYRTRVSREGPDGGIDIIAHKDELGVEPPIIKIQVKSAEGSVGDPIVSALSGKVGSGEFGLLVTLGNFTNQARAFARNKSNLRLIDGDELVELILQHYEKFDSRYKGMLPLRRVYIPEAVQSTPD